MANSSDIENCFKAVRAVVSAKVKDSQLRNLVSDLADQKNSSMSPAEFRQKALDNLNNDRLLTAQERLQKIQNLETKARNISVATQDAFKSNPAQGVLALMDHVAAQHVGPMGNARSIIHDAQQRWTTMATIGMKKDGVWDIFKSGKLSKEIEQELFELQPGGKPGISGSMEAQKIAINMRKVYNTAYQELKDSGMNIGFIEGFTGKVIHDPSKVMKSSFGEWYTSIINKLDHEKSFPGMNEEQKVASLTQTYENIINGKYSGSDASSAEDKIVTLFDREAVNKQKSKAKSLFFKDGASINEYRSEYGRGDLNSSFASYINQNSRNLGLVKAFGTNPKAGFQALKESIASKMNAIDKKAFLNNNEMDRVYKAIDGSLAGNPDSFQYKFLNAVQTWEQVTKMGRSVIPAMGDFNVAIHLAKSATGKNMAETTFDFMNNYMSAIPKESRREWADFFGRTLEEGHGTLHSDFADGHGGFSGMSKLQKAFFDLNPLTYHTEFQRLGMTKYMSKELAMSVESPGGIAKSMMDNLNRYGITEKDIPVLKEMVVDVGGHRVLDPAMSEKLDPGVIQNYLDKNGINKTVNQYRRDIKYAVSSYYDNFANMATLTPSEIDRQMLLHGTSANTTLGVALRMFAQFKAPAVSVARTYSRLAQSTPGKTFDTAAISSMFLGSLVSGYGILALKDIADGKTPRNPKDIKTTLDAVVAGGGATLWGDAAIQDYTGYGGANAALGFIGGPAVSTAFKGYQLGQETIKKAYAGKANPTGKQVDFALQNVPFANQIFARKALDYILLNDLQEHLDPGFMQKKQDREKKKMIENSQSYIFGQ